MIRLITDEKLAVDYLCELKCNKTVTTAGIMCVLGYGIKSDNLQFYVAFDNDTKELCGVFLRSNDRLFCILEYLYDEEEITLFINGFNDFKIFIDNDFSHIVTRAKYYNCSVMSLRSSVSDGSSNFIQNLNSKALSDVLMKNADKEAYKQFYLCNSRLNNHNLIKNFTLTDKDNNLLSVASIFMYNDYNYLCNVFTDENNRHKGYSKKLISDITKAPCFLICNESVEPLYLKCGFVTDAIWKEFLY